MDIHILRGTTEDTIYETALTHHPQKKLALNMGLPSHHTMQEFMEKEKVRSKKDKQTAVTESFMIARLGGQEAFERAKANKEILRVLDEKTGEVYWSHKVLQIENQELVRHGSRAGGSHSMQEDLFKKLQACQVAARLQV